MAENSHMNSSETSTSYIIPPNSDGVIQNTAQQNRFDRKKVRRHLNAVVSTKNADVLMIICCVISGLVDSTIYNAYGTFVSMQTGNTIFVGLGPSLGHNTNKPYGWVKSLTSIVCFILGALFFSRFCRYLQPLRRGTLFASFFIQSMFMLVATAIIQAGVINGAVPNIGDHNDIDWKSEIPIAMLSFQSAGQMVGSRVLNISEIPTVVVTSVLCDFASDPLIASHIQANAKRNRRALAFLGILCGAVVGGWITKATGEIQTVLWIAGGIKLLVAITWILWPLDPSLIA